VVVLWESSGESYYGYREPTEVALEMLEDEVSPFRQEAIKLHSLNFLDEEKIYCAAIVRVFSDMRKKAITSSELGLLMILMSWLRTLLMNGQSEIQMTLALFSKKSLAFKDRRQYN
jgi:hypothetical protein